MFYGCNFPNDFSLPECYNINSYQDSLNIFSGSQFPGSKCEKDFDNVEMCVEWLKRRHYE